MKKIKESFDRGAKLDEVFNFLHNEAMESGKAYDDALLCLEVDVISRDDVAEYKSGTAKPGCDYKYAVKWGYDTGVDTALQDHEYAFVMVYEEPDTEEERECSLNFYEAAHILEKKYKEVQRGAFEKGHFRFLVFTEKDAKTLNENTKFTLTIGQLKKLVKDSIASGPTCEESLDQISADAQKAKEAYLNGENSEASDIVFKIIKDARNVSNRLTETTGGPLVESNQGLVDQVLEDPRVQMAAEQFVNCLIENVVTAPTFRTANPHAPMLSDLITSADDIRWKRVVSAINLVKMNYKGAK